MLPAAGPGEAPVLSQQSPVCLGEIIFRRIPPGWFQPGKTKQIPQRAFMPRQWESDDKPGDTDGLSVSRKSLASEEVASTRPDNGKRFHLAAFPAATAFDLGLTIEPKTSPSHLGEAVIPKMNSLDAREEKQARRIEEWAIALRDSAKLVYEAPAAG